MMPPNLPGVRYIPAQWTTFTHEIQISYYDGPRAYIKHGANGQNYLAIWNDTYDDIQRWLHLPLKPEELKEVLTGNMPIRKAFKDAEFFYVSDEDSDGTFTRTSITWFKEDIPGFNMKVEGLPNENVTMNFPADVVKDWVDQLPRPA